MNLRGTSVVIGPRSETRTKVYTGCESSLPRYHEHCISCVRAVVDSETDTKGSPQLIDVITPRFYTSIGETNFLIAHVSTCTPKMQNILVRCPGNIGKIIRTSNRTLLSSKCPRVPTVPADQHLHARSIGVQPAIWLTTVRSELDGT